MKSRKKIEEILKGTDNEAKLNLFSFDSSNSAEEIYRKYILFSRSQYPRYFKTKSAPFHKDMIINEINSYLGIAKKGNYLNIAFRGSSKTTGKKLFVVFALLNDVEHRRKYMKVLTRDLKNAKQVVTDVFNLILEVEPIYGNKFEQKTEKKTEKTMSSFTMTTGVKLTAGTVGQTQRGHVQDAYRPDWVWFDDIEDSESIQSDVITQGIIRKVDKTIQGLAFDGNWTCTANYISDIGVIEHLKKKDCVVQITPLLDEKGDPTWSRYSPEKVASIRANADDFYGEYMCDPVSGNKREFTKELFKYVTPQEVAKLDTLCYITIDPAVLKGETNDYFGFTVNWVSTENKWHFKSWRKRMDMAELFSELFNLFDLYNPEKIGLEETTFTQAIQPFLKEEMRKRNKFLPIVPLKHGGNKKEVRIRSLHPRYENDGIFHIEGECEDLEQELLRFPHSKHDDASDSASYQSQIAEPPYNLSSDDDDEDYDDGIMYADLGL